MTESRRSARIAGRATELTRLDRDLRSAKAGELRVVLIVGEPGVGKTRLAGEFRSRHSKDTLDLQARGYPTGSTAAFSLWVEALEGHLRTMGTEEIGRLGPNVADLATLLPSFATARDASEPPERPSRTRILQALTMLVESLSRTKPLVVIFDDVHLADPSSWEALSYVAHNASTSRALFVLTARPGELEQHRVASELLLALEQEEMLEKLQLGPLHPDELRELVLETMPQDQGPTEALLDWLFDRSRGNPLFALGLLEALLDSDGDLTVPQLDVVPSDLTQRIDIQIERLHAAPRRLVELLAVVGRRVEISDLVAFSTWPIGELAAPLDDLTRARLLVVEEDDRQVDIEIVHPLVQEAIYQSIGVVRRRTLHRDIARALMQTSLGEAAGHFGRSASSGDQEAIEALRDAVRDAEAAGAFPEALAIMAALVRIIPAGDARWLEVLDALVLEAEWVVDHRADGAAHEGVQALRELDAVLTTIGSPAQRAMVKFRMASFLAWGRDGDLDEAERMSREAVELFERAGNRSGALLAANELAWGRYLRGRFADTESQASEIAEQAETESLRFVALQAHSLAGGAAMWRGRFECAEAWFMRSLKIARADAKGYRESVSLASVAWLRALEGRITEAPGLLEQAREAFPPDAPLQATSIVYQYLGDLPAAFELAREVLDGAAGQLGPRTARILLMGAMAAQEMGQTGEARRMLVRHKALFADATWNFQYVGHTWVDALILWREGRLGEAIANVDDVCAAYLDMDALALAVFALVDLAELATIGGQPEMTESAVARLERLADTVDRDFHRSLLSLAAAWASLGSGRAERAVTDAQAAVEFLTGSGYRLYHARALDVLGRSRSAAGSRAASIEAFSEAASIYATCGAVPRRDAVLEELRGLGQPGRRAAAAAAGSGSLTRREREVAQLAAQGLPAREIAERLFIGERTVETHLANAYPKLGVESKIELIRKADDLSL